MFLYKNLFFSIASVISIPIMLIGINGGYFPAICRLCFVVFLKNNIFVDFLYTFNFFRGVMGMRLFSANPSGMVVNWAVTVLSQYQLPTNFLGCFPFVPPPHHLSERTPKFATTKCTCNIFT